MATGVTKFFNKDKGFGFIVPDTAGPDIFCHVVDLKASGLTKLTEGQKVKFDTAPGRDGKLKAINISLA